MINYKAIGRRIRDYRKDNNITQEKFAEMLSISIEHLSRVETGVMRPSLNLIQNICQTINCDEEELMFGTKKSSDIDTAIAEKLKGLTPSQKTAVLSIIDIIANI